jgi:hypothetical protein
MNPTSPENHLDSSLKPSQGGTAKLYIAEGSDAPIEFILNAADYHSSSISEADYIVYPCLVRDQKKSLHKTKTLLSNISRQYVIYNKKVIVFILGDYEGKYPFYQNLCLIRTSVQATKMATNECVMPYLWGCKDEPFAPAPSSDLPGIGFCGQVLRQFRGKLVSEFEDSSRIRCDFIKRDAFWGGKPHDPGLMSDFWNNLMQNPFALAPRGGGNYSMRFYQALSIGRIPVLINTDTTLPFSNLIPWKNFIVLEDNEKQCVQRVLEIFDSGQVVTLQQMCFQVFHKYLSHKVFLGHLLQQLNPTVETKISPWWMRWKFLRSKG